MMLKYTMLLVWVLAAMIAVAVPVHGQTTFEWDRNVEMDMHHYEVYSCNTSSVCIPGTGAPDRLGADVLQPAVGVKPSMAIPVNTEGRAGVVAVDLVGNKSGLSNIVPFDRKAPAAATGLVTK